MSQSLLSRPEVLLEKGKIGDQIGDKSYREIGNQNREFQVGELPYDCIDAHQTNHLKIKNLIWSLGK